MDCSPPGSPVLGILQVRILQWVAMPSSGGFSQPKDGSRITGDSSIAGGFFTVEPQGKPLIAWVPWIILVQSFPSWDVFTAWLLESQPRTGQPVHSTLQRRGQEPQCEVPRLGSAHSGESVLRETEELSSWWVSVLTNHEKLGAEGTTLSHGHVSRSITLSFSTALTEAGQALWIQPHHLWFPFLPITPCSLCSSCPGVLTFPQTPQAHFHSGLGHVESLLWPFYHKVIC